MAQFAGLIAAEEGADPARAAYLGLRHDSRETRITDIPHSARPYLGEKASNETITRDQAAHTPDAAAKTVSKAVIEYEARETLEAQCAKDEAQCAKDADKLECLLQALEYRAAGYQHVQKWIDRSRTGIKTSLTLRGPHPVRRESARALPTAVGHQGRQRSRATEFPADPAGYPDRP